MGRLITMSVASATLAASGVRCRSGVGGVVDTLPARARSMVAMVPMVVVVMGMFVGMRRLCPLCSLGRRARKRWHMRVLIDRPAAALEVGG